MPMLVDFVVVVVVVVAAAAAATKESKLLVQLTKEEARAVGPEEVHDVVATAVAVGDDSDYA